MINRRQQRGVTMIGMVMWGIVIVFIALFAMKLIPAYTEYLEIRKILKDLGSEMTSRGMSNSEIRERFEKRAMIDNVTTVRSNDLRIGHSDGRTVVSVEYTFETPLVANISLLVDFSASSDSRESKMAQQLE